MKDYRTRSISILLVMGLLALAGCGGDGGGGGGEVAGDLPEIQEDVNLVVNGSFEEWDGFMPVGWNMRHWSGEGQNSNYYGKNSEWHIDGEYSYFLRSLFNTDKWMVPYQTFPVRPGYELHFQGQVKTDGLTRSKGQDDNACIYVIFYDADGERVSTRYWADSWTARRVGTSPWALNKMKLDVPRDARSVELGLMNQMTGYIYFDQVECRLVKKLHWEERQTKFVTFYWQPERPFPDGAIEREVQLVEDIAKEAGIRKIEGDRISYYLYPSEEFYLKTTGRKMYKQFARWPLKELHTLNELEDHDMIHMILYDLGTPPMGIAKGLVFYFRAKFNGWDLHAAAKQDLMATRLPALYKTISKRQFGETNVSVVIPGWGSFTTWLIDRYGIKKVLDLYTETDKMDEFGPVNVHFKDIFGEDMIEMDKKWRWWLLRYEVEAEADTIF
ncbi:MAG TPA: hypothetical protein VLA34_00645 [Candidatus Krumholzibacterium sp.]|nr:hypothetical protein [Candidatus Krumholzibacterium sp.]